MAPNVIFDKLIINYNYQKTNETLYLKAKNLSYPIDENMTICSKWQKNDKKRNKN